MPRQYPAEFRHRAIALVRAGKPVKHVTQDLAISAGGLQQWVRQDRIDRGEIPGTSTTDHTELVRAKRRIRELEIVKRAAKLLGEETPHPKESTR